MRHSFCFNAAHKREHTLSLSSPAYSVYPLYSCTTTSCCRNQWPKQWRGQILNGGEKNLKIGLHLAKFRADTLIVLRAVRAGSVVSYWNLPHKWHLADNRCVLKWQHIAIIFDQMASTLGSILSNNCPTLAGRLTPRATDRTLTVCELRCFVATFVSSVAEAAYSQSFCRSDHCKYTLCAILVCKTSLFTTWCYASAVYAVVVCPSIRASVCPCVTSRHCTQAAKRRITQYAR